MIGQDTIVAALGSQFNKHVRLSERRPGIFQVHAPLFHEDGDMLDIFVEPTGDDTLRVCDYGMTLMRLSYNFDLDTDNKQRIFAELIKKNNVEFDERDGNIYIEATPESLCPALLQLSQTIAKVSSLEVLKREVVSGLFFEMVDDFIAKHLQEFNPQLRAMPLGRDDLEVTCAFHIKPHPVYLYAVRGSAQARLAALVFLECQRAEMMFKGYVVHDNFESLSTKDKSRITSAADKQFINFEDFRERSRSTLLRDVA